LKHNLALLLGDQQSRAADAQRRLAESRLQPNVTGAVSESVEQVNLAALGLSPSSFPGIPSIVGPFSVFDGRARLSQSLFNWSSIETVRAARLDQRSAKLSYEDAREQVVQVVTTLYLQAAAGTSRVNTAEAQFETAKALYTQAVSLKNSGVAAGIDVLRAQVQMQTQQQRVLSATNDLEKEKIALARAIGLPSEQQFSVVDPLSFADMTRPSFSEARNSALNNRADYRQAKASVAAAQASKQAAQSQRLPTVRFDADYGTLGNRPGSSHGTFTTAASLQFPIFDGGRIRAETEQADSLLQQREALLTNLSSRIEEDIRVALLDLNNAAAQVQVAQSSVELAAQQLKQAQDRFRSGVANTIEVVQAQETVASANESYIGSVFAYNLAKTSLARATGVAEKDLASWLRTGG
jgi:outer membrane protein TolC